MSKTKSGKAKSGNLRPLRPSLNRDIIIIENKGVRIIKAKAVNL